MAVATERLWLTVDGDVVLDEDPAARTLLCSPGDDIPEGHSPPKGRKQAELVEDKSIAESEADKAVKRTPRKKS